MSSQTVALVEQFSMIEDPRVERSKKYPLVNILVFSFVLILAGQESWYQMQMFYEETLQWFAEFLDVSSGVPRHDAFQRVFSLINPEDFEVCVIRWLEELRKKRLSNQRVIALYPNSFKNWIFDSFCALPKPIFEVVWVYLAACSHSNVSIHCHGISHLQSLENRSL